MAREYDQDGYYIIPKTDNYPGLVAKQLKSGREIVASGDPELAKEAIDARIDEIQAEEQVNGSLTYPTG